jgi:uncharacterized surface protein with fasciclin (FAS1) repeats
MKKITTLKNRILSVLMLGFAVVISVSSCQREHITYSTTSDVNIYSYLEGKTDDFSLFKQIIDKAGYASFLNTYGTYTLFASNNAGVNAYLKSSGKASVDAIDEATAKKILSISLVPDTINTQLFSDGKMRTPTTAGQYLITGAANVGGVSSITVNRQANLVKGNIRVGNGIIHVIDNVLMPAPLTLAQMVEQDAKYSIFSQALKATGFYDTLNVAASAQTNLSRKFLTLIAQTNDVFAAAGIPDYNTLRSKYSTTGNPKDHTDSLWLFVAYRIFPELSYLSDVVASASHSTLAPLEVTTSELSGQNVLLNNIVFNGVLEPGAILDRSLSDNSATNGVLHAVQTNYKIKVRKPTPIYWDVADQPEIRRTPGVFRAASKKETQYVLGQLADVTWAGGSGGNYMAYNTVAPTSTTDFFYGNDYLAIGLRFRTGSNGVNTVTFKTPLLVKGRYKIWVDWKRGTGQALTVLFDGQPVANVFNSADAVNDTDSEATLESKGYKRYSESPLVNSSNSHSSRLLGVVNIPTTDRHTMTFTTTAASNAAQVLNLDVVEFRPIDMPSQLLPKLGRDGTLKF